MSDERIEERPDYDLPGNDLNPATPPAYNRKRLPPILKVYGVICTVYGILTIPVTGVFVALIAWAMAYAPDAVAIGENATLPVVLFIVDVVVTIGNAVGLIAFGISLVRNHRRWAGRISNVLILGTVVQLIVDVMLQGMGPHLLVPAVQLVILLVISVTVDPALRQERQLQQKLRILEDRDAAQEGMLGRDPEGKGYIELNFFNLFWVYLVCSVFGLIIEDVFHMTITDPGVYQDRAGLLYGPFSPIYGVGAVLLTVILNRFWRANSVAIFFISALIGGVFEAAVSVFMQISFGAVSWSYSSYILGVVPDYVAILTGGRTSTVFMVMWGALGLMWIKVLLPKLLTLINCIPWRVRYSLTSALAVLMLADAVLTLTALDCWFGRVSGVAQTTPVQQFCAEHYDNDYMANRFQTMTIVPEDSGRIDPSASAS